MSKDDTRSASFKEKLERFRALLKERGVQGFLVPKADEFQNEMVPAHFDRLKWLTGFSGSAGLAAVLAEEAILYVDSRYTLQAKTEVDASLFRVELWPQQNLPATILKHFKAGGKLGYDPKVHTKSGFKALEEAAKAADVELVGCDENPIDALWTSGREPAVYYPIVAHEIEFAGSPAEEKLKRLQAALKEKGCAGAMMTAPDNIAWLLNIRGRDTARTPIALVRAYVPLEGVPTLFAEAEHITAENRLWLEKMVNIEPLPSLGDALPKLIEKDAQILADGAAAPVYIWHLLEGAGANILDVRDPCQMFKAVKNEVELEGARRAHLRDGAAMCRFLCWLDETVAAGTVIDEISAANKLEAFRRETGALQDLSFDTISGAGANGAIVHYRVSEKTNAKLLPGELYLVDSGGQYKDGTTDVTRTIAIGAPSIDQAAFRRKRPNADNLIDNKSLEPAFDSIKSEQALEMRTRYTLVLKGHLSISMARFPKNTRGVDLDVLARASLWRHGLDYGHGTGHGVGSYLSVHEGPQALSRNATVALEPGMILSNEPGFYLEGHYGIRIENLVTVTGASEIEGGQVPMQSFEVLTLAPYDRSLIEPALLEAGERGYLDAYHARVYREVGPLLNERERAWLQNATAPLT